MTLEKCALTLNEYLSKYPEGAPCRSLSVDDIKCNKELRLALIDYIIALFGKIGLSESLAPSMDGIILDSCLELLAELN